MAPSVGDQDHVELWIGTPSAALAGCPYSGPRHQYAERCHQSLDPGAAARQFDGVLRISDRQDPQAWDAPSADHQTQPFNKLLGGAFD
ncbi:hypothetical protein ACWGI8_41675, partial [Streptomyces sp. NPDC054841]